MVAARGAMWYNCRCKQKYGGKTMKKNIVIIVIAVLVVIIALPIVNYNSLVAGQTAVEAGKADIATQLQRRADLIPNLIQTVNNFTTHETEVFAAVTEAREAMLSAGSVGEMAAADEQMTAALGRLVAVAEAYPELKSDSVYVGLMDELAGTENRIAVARKDYNADVESYNVAIRRFPGVLFAKLFGFQAAEYFEADAAAQEVPSV